MPNGTVGDDPILDITVHRLPVFSPNADRLVRLVLVLMNSTEVEGLRAMLRAVPANERGAVDRLEQNLIQMKHSLLARAAEQGWDAGLLQARLEEEE